jgi:hypothetical protein
MMKFRGLLQSVQRNRAGQSLVEVAIFLPILIFILAGLVEVSNLLVTQNKVTTSSRIAAGFGASNFNPDNWDITAQAMGDVNINTITETLELDQDLWDIWAVRIETNAAGDGFRIFTSTHVYGANQVVTNAEWNARQADLQNEVLESLQSECPTPNLLGVYECAANMEAVASVPSYNLDTILGLPVWQWAGLKETQGLTVMRVGQKPPFRGCPILPITIRLQQWSVYPTDWDPPLEEDGIKLQGDLYDNHFGAEYGSDPVDRFPAKEEFDYPDGKKGAPPPPEYTMVDNTITNTIKATSYTLNVPGMPLDLARPGHIYWAREVGASGNFGWLAWRDEPGYTSEGALETALTYPGNFLDENEGYVNGNMDEAGNLDNPGVLDPPCNTDPDSCGNGDHWLAGSHYGVAGEWVANSTGNVNASGVRQAMEFYVNNPTVDVFLIIYDFNNGETGENLNYHVWDFAKVKILGWKFTATEKWLIFEFVNWGVDCQPPS